MSEPTNAPRKRPARALRPKSRIYWRDQGGERRAYADFRDLGGKRIPLIPEGDKRATTNPELAEQIAAKRLQEIIAGKRDREAGKKPATPIGEYASYHLVAKAKSGRYSELWLEDSERMLGVAIEHFGKDRDLGTITVSEVQRYADVLGTRPTKRKRSEDAPAMLGPGTVRHYLNVLSSLYERAESEERVGLGYNPVAKMLDKPAGTPEEAKWLTVAEGALLLESARTFAPQRARTFPFIYPLVATYLLTGGRETEVLGLEVNDVDFANATITFRTNQWRRLKTRKSGRTIPLWPQLAEILRAYVKATGRKAGLLFPSPFLDKPGMIVDWRKQLDAIASRTGLWKAGDVRSKMLRHTYCSTRLQTTDGDKPIAVFTVSRELGHANTKMVETVYGHVGNLPHRSSVVEYRVQQHKAKLARHLKLLKSA
jgi:integrase